MLGKQQQTVTNDVLERVAGLLITIRYLSSLPQSGHKYMKADEGSNLVFRESTDVRPPTQNLSRRVLSTPFCAADRSRLFSGFPSLLATSEWLSQGCSGGAARAVITVLTVY
jgi:hypothetical protein